MVFFAAVISIFFAVGFGLLGYGLWSMKRSTEAGSWPMTGGTVESCSIETNYGGDGNTYQVKVKYSYTVGGVDYTNDKLAFGYSASGGPEAHNEILSKL